MILQYPYAVCALVTGGILLVLLVMHKVRPLYRFSTAFLVAASVFLLATKSMEEGGNDFRTADTIRILATNRRVLRDWYNEAGSYPAAGPGGIDALKSYDSKVFYRDAWDRPLRYELVSGSPRLTSAGADGAFDTDDDVVR